MLKKIKILCTIGPSTNKKNILKNLENYNVDLYRINLSHTKVENLKNFISKIKKKLKCPYMYRY